MGDWLKHGIDECRVRGERGFADVDWWNGDTYLCGVIGSVVRKHYDHGSGYPQSMTEDEWKAILAQIWEPLLAYAEGKFDADTVDAERALAENARVALTLFAQHFTRFWD